MIDDETVQDLQVLELESFEVPFPMTEEQQERYRRRFLTLLIQGDSSPHRGGSGCVYKVMNAEGETFAMKCIEHQARAANMSDERYERLQNAQVAAFRMEFENQQRLSGLKGFPKLFGYGMAGGEPLIVMEWVEGNTCMKARELRRADPKGKRVPPLIVAKLGVALFDLISRFDYLDDSFAHRDISPNNIMLRTDTTSIEEQVDNESFDLCLIDFGSATLLNSHEDPTFTTLTNVLRKATPEYAPPEMLTDDLPNLTRLRQSALIDVYAIASVLYELLCGETPYRLSKLVEDPQSYYRYKLEHRIPLPATLHADMTAIGDLSNEPNLAKVVEGLKAQGNFDPRRFIDAVNVVDQQLGHILLKALSNNQNDRAQAWDMKDMLTRFVKNYSENIERRYSGDHLIPFLDATKIPERPKRPIPLSAPRVPQTTTVLRAANMQNQPTMQMPYYPATSQPARYPSIQVLQSGAYMSQGPTMAEPPHTEVPLLVGGLVLVLVAAVAMLFSTLIQNMPGALPLLGINAAVPVPLFICLLGSLAPPLVALPFYWVGSTPGTKLLAGTIALTFCDLIVWVLVHSAKWVLGATEPLCALCLVIIAVIMTVGIWLTTMRRERS